MENSGELPEQIQFEGYRRYTSEQMQAMSHYEISDTGLSIRVKNLLSQNGCCTLDQAAAFAEGDLIYVRRAGRKTADEIFSALDNWIIDHPLWKNRDTETSINFSEGQRKTFNAISSALKSIVGISWYQVAGLVEEGKDFPGVDQFSELPFEQQLSLVIKHPLMRSSLEIYWKEMMPCGITKIRTIKSKLADTPLGFDAQVLIQCSLETDIICKIDGYYLIKRQTISEYINSPDFDNKNGRILKMRFNGAKLDEIGDRVGLSRERVRQIITSRIRKFPLLFEDYFAGPFQAIRFTPKEFRRLFPEISKDGYGYLSVRYEKGKEPIDKACADDYSGLWKERVSRFIQNESEDRKVLFNSTKEVIWSILNDNADQPLSMASFKEEYGKKIEQMAQYSYNHDLKVKSLGSTSSGTLTNILRCERGIVFNRENKIRSCKADLKAVWETIDFDRYKNLVISSELIYRDYSELMAEQQILDGHELFYIIKNSVSDFWNGDFRIRCRRVPVIVFGEATEADQAIQLLKELSPVSHNSYYAAYEQRFGTKKDSAHGNPAILRALEPYNTDKMYVLDASADSKNK